MSEPEVTGVLSFPGVTSPQFAIVSKLLGTRPSVAMLYAQPQPGSPDTSGAATFNFGSSTTALSWTDALCDAGTLQMTSRGFRQIFTIFDRRWKWSKSSITGAYNVRRTDGTIDPATEKTLEELATILFTAMGEGSANVTALSSVTEKPEVIWDHDAPDDELDALLLPRGFVVALLNNNTAKVFQRGTGAPLPVSNDLVSVQTSIDPPEIPEILRVVCNYTMVQSMLKMVPVGLDTDGQWKLVDDLSYAPAGGWAGKDLETMAYITDPVARELGLQTVGRCFQVTSQADGTQDISFGDVDYVPGEIEVTSADQLLPLRRFLLETEEDVFGKLRYKEAYVSGTFAVEPVTTAANMPPAKIVNTDPFTRIDKRDWELNEEYGIITFADLALKYSGTGWDFADVYLTCSYGVHANDVRVKDRYEVSRTLGGVGVDEDKLDEFQRTLTVAYTAGTSTISGITDTAADVTTAADQYLDAAVSRYVTTAGNLLLYRDIQDYGTDGVAWQVQWSVGAPDPVPFHTRVSQYAEMIPLLLNSSEQERVRQIRRNGSPTNRRNNRYVRKMFGRTAPGAQGGN